MADHILAALSKGSSWPKQHEAALLEPYTYLSSHTGKGIRTRLLEAFNVWLNVPKNELEIICRIVNMLHSASLLVDDIEDDSQLRRGHPVAHKIYGIPQTINTANYVYFLAFKELSILRKVLVKTVDLDSIVTEELLLLHRGQGLDILWRDSLSCPTEEEYIHMVNNKTGGLLRIGVKLMMACGTTNVDVDYISLANLFGVYYQIRDDYMNLQSTSYTRNKGLAEDISEGKFSFPIVHSINADKSDRRIMNILQQRPSTPTLKLHAIDYIHTWTGSFDYTLGVLHALEVRMLGEIARLGGNAKLREIAELLHVD